VVPLQVTSRRPPQLPPRRAFRRFIAKRRIQFWSIITGADIAPEATLGGGLMLPHPNGIVFHRAAVIGVNCMIMQQVTIGQLASDGAPRLGNNVYVGAGAKVLGPITIGDGASIGANAVVLADVPAARHRRRNPGPHRPSARDRTNLMAMRFSQLALSAAAVVHPIKKPIDVFYRARFLSLILKNRAHIQTWLDAGDAGGLVTSLADRPQMIGPVIWPYLHKDWSVAERFAAVRAHFAELESIPWLRLGVNDSRTIADLGDLLPGLRIVLDRPLWFLREGELTLNIFVMEHRVYSLSFLLGRTGDPPGARIALIGAMQGRNLDNIESIYRDLTKKLHGARPRDFIFTVFQLLAAEAQIQHIRGVSDACRHHHHPYFGTKAQTTQSASYDDIWKDRDGTPGPGGFFTLPLTFVPRPESEIPSHKRSMYRKRYALYDRLAVIFSAFAT
jgi:uncharacterized protein VirK/YbjX